MKFNAPIIIVASVICLFIGCAAGKSGAQAEADATTARTIRDFKELHKDSLYFYREAYGAAVGLINAMEINDDSIDPYYDGPDRTLELQSRAYRRYCEESNKLDEFLK